MSKLLMFVVLAGHAVGQKHTSHWIVNGGHCQIQGSCVVPPANAFGQRCSFTSFLEPGWAVRGFNTTSPQLVENPPHYYWMAAPAGRTTPEWKYCLLESCALATCDAGHLLRTDAAEIVPVNQSDCCEASCGQFPCPLGFTLRADANTTVAHGEGTCCERLCSSFHCPAAFEPIFNAHLVKGDRVSQCCRKLPECQMNSNYKPVDMAGTKPRKVDSAAQCFELCERTPFCSGFSWFRDRSCHLADANASLQFSAHSASGNRSCYAKLPAAEKKAATKGQFSRSYCQRQPKRCSGRRFETVGPRVWNDMKHSVTRGLDVVDWDGDGFLDLVTVSSSEPGTEFAYASLDLHIQLHNDPLPKGHITLEDSGEFVSRPQLSIFDWDSDGKLDVLIGMASGQLRFFKGVDPQLPPSARSATLHHFQPAEEPHPFTSIHGHNNSAPAMALWNEDEYPDLVLAHACQVDIFLGSADGSLHLAYSHYFDDGKCRFVPTVWDWDSDGKPDLIVGDEQGKLHLCKSDSMEQLQCSQEEFKILGVGSDASPAACDWDKDGVPDLFVYGKSELVAKPYWFRRNESGVAVMNPAHPLDGIDLGDDAVPTLVDWDRDGDLDLIVGSGDGRVWYFPWHNGSFHSMNGLDGPFAQIDVGSKAAPATVDWDLDGYPDLVVGNGKGSLAFFRGGPGKIDPAGVEENPFYFIQTGLQVAPAFADMDGDGDFDLVFTSGKWENSNSGTFYFANHNGELVPELSPIEHVDLSPLAGSVQAPSCLQLVDFDGDGDLDLLTGSNYDTTVWFVEQFEDGTFYHAQGASNPFGAGMIGLSPCPALGDIELDGVGDLVVGDQHGMLLMFQHQPTQRFGLGANVEDSQHHPLGSLNEQMWGAPRKPTAVDWNGDGLLDLIVVAETIELLFQTDDGTFSPATAAPFDKILKNMRGGHYPGTLRSVDWDFDGDMDLVLFCESGVFFFERMGEELAAPKQLVFNSTTAPEGVNLGIVFSGDIVDWDGDGDWDLILCPTFSNVILLALQEDNEFRIVPDADSPFRAVQFVGSQAVITIADLDADGYLDMLVGTTTGKISVFRQDSSHAFVHQEEFDVELPSGGPTGPVFGDWDGDGDLEVLVGTSTKWEYFKFGDCQLQDPCFVNAGFCLSGVCQCIEGHGGKDCSKCISGFATVQRSSKSGHACMACPGVRSEAGPCNGKGRCFDDQLSADFLTQQGLTVIQPLGNGSCWCNTPFLGADCNEGECPAGTELSRFSNGTLSCTSCLPGFGKEAAGNRQCQACEPGMFSNGSGFCQPCEAGMRQASYGQAACEFCQPGHAPRDDAKFCLSCSRGTYAAAGDASCQPCEPGSYQRDTGQTFCEVCPAGFTTDEDRTACNRCQAGTFSKDSLTGCQTCGGFTTPNEQQTNCIPSWAKLAGAVVFTFFAAFFMWLLPFLIGIKRHIADVSWLPTDEAVILTTQQKHQFSSKYIPVVFHDTGVSWLQESTESTTEDGETKSAPTISIMYVKRTSPTQLQIYTEPGCPLAQRAETSIGTFQPTPLAEVFGSVFLGIPVVLWMGVSIAGMIAIALLIHIPWWYYIATFVFDFFVVLALRLLQRRHDAATPLQALLASYKAKVMTNPTPCDPGPLRSVNVGKLCKFEEHFRSILQRRSMYYVCPNLVKPLTKEKEVSFAEFVGCDLVDWFISHFWGLPFCDFILSLQQHAKHHAENWEDVRYWICTFSNNQWKMDEEIPRDAPPTESSFFKALTSPTCLGTGMMMDVDVTPLKRSWCLFEMLHTFRQRDHTQERPIAFQGLLMLTPQGVLNTGRGSLDTALRIGQRLTTLKLEEAMATEIADKEKIDAEVRAQEGGFPAINAKLRSEICQVLEQMASTFTEDLSELTRQLRERELNPTCNETSPLEVHVADDDPVRPKPWQQRPSAAFGAELTKWAKFRTFEINAHIARKCAQFYA